MMRRPTAACQSTQTKPFLFVLLVAFAALFSLNANLLKPDEAEAKDVVLQKTSPAIKGLGIIAAAAAVASIPKFLNRRRGVKGPKKKTPTFQSTPVVDTVLDKQLQSHVGKLVTLKFPDTKDVILCRLLKAHTLNNGQFATLSIENGKVGTRVACSIVRETAMKMAAHEMIQILQKEKAKLGKDPGITLQEAMYIRQGAVQQAQGAIGNGTVAGVSHMVGPNASVITVQANLLSFPDEKTLEYFDAINKGDTQKVDSLLASGMNADAVDVSGRSALYFACREGQTEIAKKLINKGCQVDRVANNGATPLFVAAQGAHMDVMRSLIDAGADVKSPRNVTYSFIASQNGHLDALNLFLENGADPLQPSMNGFSCLYIAAQNGHTSIVKRLLEIPEIKKTVNEGMKARQMATPALIASQMGNLEVLKALVAAGADVKQPMVDGTAPIKVAAAHGDPEIIEYLISSGADVNCPNQEGYTALMAAAVKGNVRAVELLIRKGADVNLKTQAGQDALTIAKTASKNEVIQILTKATKK